MEETISLKELLEILKKRLALIISITLLAAIISGVVSYFFITPIYQASTQILVNQSKNAQSLYTGNEVQTDLQLINTYNVIIKSPAILDKVVQELNLKMTTDQLNQKITVASQTNSQVLNLSVQDPNPQVAVDIANKVAEVFKAQIPTIMKIDNVSILAQATVGSHPSPIKPKKSLNIAIAGVVGLMVGIGIAFLLDYFDTTIKSEQDIEKVLELPILGVIAAIDEKEMEELKASKVKRQRVVRGETLGS